MPRSAGMNFSQQNRAKKMALQGYSAEEIGFLMSIKDDVVQGFIDGWKESDPAFQEEKPKAKAKGK